MFYVDFVIRMKNGQVFLFDTKSEDSDKNAPCKHNALIDYIHNEENADKHLKGGVIIQTKNGEKLEILPDENREHNRHIKLGQFPSR